jgi:hypothetical protein
MSLFNLCSQNLNKARNGVSRTEVTGQRLCATSCRGVAVLGSRGRGPRSWLSRAKIHFEKMYKAARMQGDSGIELLFARKRSAGTRCQRR